MYLPRYLRYVVESVEIQVLTLPTEVTLKRYRASLCGSGWFISKVDRLVEKARKGRRKKKGKAQNQLFLFTYPPCLGT